MAKMLFDILVPATGRHYDFWVPGDLAMQQIADLVGQAMQVAEPAFYCYTPDCALMYAKTGEIQDPYASPFELGFSDGDRFVLV